MDVALGGVGRCLGLDLSSIEVLYVGVAFRVVVLA